MAFLLSTALAGLSLSVTQGTVITQAFPIFVSPGQVDAIMPSTVTAGLATLRVTHKSKSNATTIQIADSAPGLFAVSSGGYGSGIIQNFVSASEQPTGAVCHHLGDRFGPVVIR